MASAPFVQDDEHVAEIDPAGRECRKHVQRLFDHQPFRHVQHNSARPACGVQGGKLVGAAVDGRKQIRTKPFRHVAFGRRVLARHQLVQAAEYHALPGQFRIEMTRTYRLSRTVALPERATPSRRTACGNARLVRRRTRQRKLFEVETADVGSHPFFQAPIGQRQFEKCLPCPAAQRRQPRRLAALRQKELKGFEVETIRELEHVAGSRITEDANRVTENG